MKTTTKINLIHLFFEEQESGEFKPLTKQTDLEEEIYNRFQRKLRTYVKKLLGSNALTCQVCFGRGLIYQVVQLGNNQTFKRVLTPDHIIKISKVVNIQAGDINAVVKYDCSALNVKTYPNGVIGGFHKIIESLYRIIARDKELREFLEDNAFSIKFNKFDQKYIDELSEIRNAISLYEYLEDKIYKVQKNKEVAKNLVQEFKTKLKVHNNSIRECPRCLGYGVYDIGHDDQNPGKALFYKLLLDYFRKTQNFILETSDIEQDWIFETLKTFKIQDRVDNIRQQVVNKEKDIALKYRRELYNEIVKFINSVGVVQAISPSDFFSKTTQKQFTKIKYALVRSAYRDKLLDLILTKLKETARVSPETDVRHMVSTISGRVRNQAGSYYLTVVAQTNIERVLKRASRVSKKDNKKTIKQIKEFRSLYKREFVYAALYSDWAGEQKTIKPLKGSSFSAKVRPWSTVKTVSEIIEEAFNEVWYDIYKQKFPYITSTIKATYTLEDYFKYIQIFGEKYGK